MATQLAGELYKQLGGSPLAMKEFPSPDNASVGQVSYHLRLGKHDILAWDWEHLRHVHQAVEVVVTQSDLYATIRTYPP